MHLLVVGISHRTAPVELREQLDFQARGLEGALRALATRGSTREVAVVSTCNRAELYVACEDADPARADLTTFFSDFHGIDRAALTEHIYDLADLEAAQHLFRVAAGLDSLLTVKLLVASQSRMRCASPIREYLPTESSNTMTTRLPSTTACITRQRPAAEM